MLAAMGTNMSPREVHNMRVLMISTQLMMCCVCGVLVMPLQGECWQRTSTALQMAASCGYGMVAVGRMFALLGGDLLPLAIERLYVCAGAVLFAACGGVSLFAAATGDSAWGAAEPWDAREVSRAALALFTALTLVGDAATCHWPAAPLFDPADLEAPDPLHHPHDSPPPYSIAISEGARALPH